MVQRPLLDGINGESGRSAVDERKQMPRLILSDSAYPAVSRLDQASVMAQITPDVASVPRFPEHGFFHGSSSHLVWLLVARSRVIAEALNDRYNLSRRFRVGLIRHMDFVLHGIDTNVPDALDLLSCTLNRIDTAWAVGACQIQNCLSVSHHVPLQMVRTILPSVWRFSLSS